MMVVRVGLEIAPDKEHDFLAYMREESARVRLMPGCLRYEVFRSTDRSGFLLYEEWESVDAFEQFKQSPTLKKSFSVLGPMLAGPPATAYYRAYAEPSR